MRKLNEKLEEVFNEKDVVQVLITPEDFNDWKKEIEKLVDELEEQERHIKEANAEIERLNNKVEELMTLYTTERNVKEDYKSIIKEVREYIDKEHKLKDLTTFKTTYTKFGKDILEILDKENKE